MDEKDFLWRNMSTGTTHVIKSGTSRTYCGFHALVLEGWRPIGPVPALPDHLPTCRICAKGFRKDVHDAETRELRKAADEFLEAIKESVDSYVLLNDVESLGRLVTQVEIVGAYEVVKAIRDKGFDKELTALCDKVGRGTNAGN